MSAPSSLLRDISPPSLKRRRVSQDIAKSGNISLTAAPTRAAVEAGKAKIDDPLTFFKEHLAMAKRESPPDRPSISIEDFSALYERNQHDHGHHFVIHQHNHPKAGVHYDLRLQFSKTSSLSFAVPKGLPGNPNSKSIGRMAIETRVHNLWNHLIESASHKTGSLLIWDTGTYEVLPRKKEKKGTHSRQTTDDESEMSESSTSIAAPVDEIPENNKLIAGFQTRYIRLRLHGVRLPKNYTITLRLPSNEIIKPQMARRRNRRKTRIRDVNDTDSGNELEGIQDEQKPEPDLDTDTDEDLDTRQNNAYPGSTNDIGSIHQRHWFLQLDRQSCGFVTDRDGDGKVTWRRRSREDGFDPFLVRGRDYERSVVTGRLAREVEIDEGVEGYVGRGGWVGIEH